jgi:hypothetical protein
MELLHESWYSVLLDGEVGGVHIALNNGQLA